MKAGEFSAQFPPGFDHGAIDLLLTTASPAWQGKTGKFLADAGEFVVVLVDDQYRLRLPWAQVTLPGKKGKA